MSTTARKARKREQRATGTHYQRTPKTPTPVMERSEVTKFTSKPDGEWSPRSPKKVARYLEARGIEAAG